MKYYQIKIIHEFIIEAESEEEAEKICLQKPYSQATDCYLETQETYMLP